MNETRKIPNAFINLTLIFIILKLTKYIDWSWWWILFPTYSVMIILLSVKAMSKKSEEEIPVVSEKVVKELIKFQKLIKEMSNQSDARK